MGDIPEILYKYRTFEKEDSEKSYGRHTLTRNTLFAASPSSFNDPFDNALPYKYSEESFTLDNFTVRYLSSTPEKHLTREELIRKAKSRYDYILSNPEAHWKDHQADLLSMDAKFYGIISLSKIPDNILMWSHYADYHRGYCLGFSTEILMPFLAAKFDTDGLKFGSVIYTDEYPQLDLMLMGSRKHAIERGFTKHADWSYEEEYRVVLNNRSDQLISLPKDIVKEVYLGSRMPADTIKEVVIFLKNNNPNAKLYQMGMSFHKFGLGAEILSQ